MIQTIEADNKELIQRLCACKHPSIRFWMQQEGFQAGDGASDEIRHSIREDVIDKKLLSERDPNGKIDRFPYEKWVGAHWILNLLAELNYPMQDEGLFPLREQVFQWIFSDEVRIKQTPIINRLYRRHASQEGNLLFSLIQLGLYDARVHDLVDIMLTCQWPDGGWNCDKNPQAHTSSFIESIYPLRGLIAYQKKYNNPQVANCIERGLEFFLQRKLFRRLRDDSIIHPNFMDLTYPHYHIYDILIGLKVMDAAGKIDDPRCQEALDLLENKYIPGQGWRIEQKYEQYDPSRRRYSLVRWNEEKSGRANDFLSAQVLIVLKHAGRI